MVHTCKLIYSKVVQRHIYISAVWQLCSLRIYQSTGCERWGQGWEEAGEEAELKRPLVKTIQRPDKPFLQKSEVGKGYHGLDRREQQEEGGTRAEWEYMSEYHLEHFVLKAAMSRRSTCNIWPAGPVQTHLQTHKFVLIKLRVYFFSSIHTVHLSIYPQCIQPICWLSVDLPLIRNEQASVVT